MLTFWYQGMFFVVFIILSGSENIEKLDLLAFWLWGFSIWRGEISHGRACVFELRFAPHLFHSLEHRASYLSAQTIDTQWQFFQIPQLPPTFPLTVRLPPLSHVFSNASDSTLFDTSLNHEQPSHQNGVPILLRQKPSPTLWEKPSGRDGRTRSSHPKLSLLNTHFSVRIVSMDFRCKLRAWKPRSKVWSS